MSSGKRPSGTPLRTRVLLIAASVVVLVLAIVGVALITPTLSEDSTPVATSPEPSPVLPAPQVVPVSPDAPKPSAAGLEAVLAAPLRNPDLGRFTGSVADAITGEVLWSADADTPMTPASTTKILTAAAAMMALPADHRVTTKVVAGDAAGQVVLVGDGDPTLTAEPLGRPGFYDGGARIDDLAEQIRRSGTTVTSIAVDGGAYSGPEQAQGWFPGDVAAGYIAPIEPITLDGGRSVPTVDESPRSATPGLDAGRALARALGLDPAVVTDGRAQSGAGSLATVQSAPLRQRLGQMLGFSDNVLAEAVGREIAEEVGRPASFDGATDAVLETLQKNGVDVTGVTLEDTSGLSVDNLIPARVLGALVTRAAGSGTENLRPMLDYLPVAGATGTLAARYASGDRTAAGWLRAKTGTLSTASALAGYVTDESGRVLTFALMSNDRPPEIGRPALDALASTLRSCGCT
ncbi:MULTISPECIES: D-alanyl-D-alanine carboxypeptidase/D-alanyl-D-alanine-endopeptidase [Nocardiaceae]|uniref:D-alanyl-D-alanine carboxypeptidase/D-alanyl-D-alanine-endopeptidase (Penicillin-binding protein 4) n=1 Tax=Rhodococcoides corynebacterioides TaxID=53972 RepID=A0ABS2L0I5_9NOCA|nr:MULTISPECIES: D-alanyl-D-alanine carboxypeptidase/D-alanyl-D-alanine-endopeptidase [Rhodococcus]MBM7417076.1 D-alanyl-D-alanine carboxypeptidase/D-alanyl-D-alanine-endopeptidase (penicillin-binding protein 4) [Rhodococcus corynebacterioides]MBP1115329.1 D-alanyl-D-alanine carboxypeptidase/D-alanyl-D-alanine-endopeptidase (penicillin-binding protein 4) [Rhodococcus sp. PvP016]